MVRLGYPESSIEKPLGISGAIFLQDSRLPFLLSNQQCQITELLLATTLRNNSRMDIISLHSHIHWYWYCLIHKHGSRIRFVEPCSE